MESSQGGTESQFILVDNLKGFCKRYKAGYGLQEFADAFGKGSALEVLRALGNDVC